MLILQDCIQILSDFKVAFAQKYGYSRGGAETIATTDVRTKGSGNSVTCTYCDILNAYLQNYIMAYYWIIKKMNKS